MTARKKTDTTRTAQKNHPAQISPARKAAYNILSAVERGQPHSDDLLRGKAVNALSAPDRNLATALVLGVLRWQIQLDHQIRALLARPNAKLDTEVLIALRLGAFQLLHLDRIPARAAIDESVELVKQAGHHFASGMVNAVLRKLTNTWQGAEQLYSDTRSCLSTTSQLVEKFNNEPRSVRARLYDLRKNSITSHEASGHDFSRATNAAITTRALAPEENFSADMEAHPSWMVERWINFYGLDAARSICHHGQSQPVLTARLAAPAVETELRAAGIALEPGQLLTAARTVISGDMTTFLEGRVRLQDEGSQLVAELPA